MAGTATLLRLGGIAMLAVTVPSIAGAATTLVDAVRKHDAAAIRQLLRQKVDVNTRAGDATALHWAVRGNDAGIVDLLLSAGADTNAANDYGVTPIMLACTNGNAALVSRLLAAGADANAAQESGETVLMTCAHHADASSVKALLAAGAHPNARERLQHQTALMWAVAAGRTDSVGLLLERGASVGARTLVRIEHVRDSTARSVRGGAVPTVPNLIGGFTPLLFAARHGAVGAARLLLDAGADANDKAADGMGALIVAAQSNHGSLAMLLLERGANPNGADVGYAALHAAILRADVGLVKALLARGADPNAVVTRGNPPRRYGYQWDISMNNVGATPFLLAARFGEPEIMRLLADAGADPLRSLPSTGATPLMMAAGIGWNPPDDLGDSGADRRGRVLARDRMFAEWDDEERWLATVNMALAFKPDVHARSTTGDTAVHAAARLGLTRVVDLLVSQGARLDLANAQGHTAEMLLKRGRPRR